MVDKVLVLGDGGWGTAIAMVLCERGVHVDLWCHDAEYAAEMLRTRRNSRYLPGIELPRNLEIVTDSESVAAATTVFSVVPSQYLDAILERVAPAMRPGQVVVSCTKGIVFDGPKRPTELIRERLGDIPIVVLNGPSHAEEVARRMPTTVVAACKDEGMALWVQDLMTTDRFRVYSNAPLPPHLPPQ